MSHGASPLAAFHLIGDRAPLENTSPEPLELQPALFGRYQDLSRLRTDYPVVLVNTADNEVWVKSLSDIVDELLQSTAEPGTAGEETRRQVLALEQHVRNRVARGEEGLLSRLWDIAREDLVGRDGESTPGQQALDSALRSIGASLPLDGELVSCDKQLSIRLITRAWQENENLKTSRMQKRIGRLAQKLGDILQANYMSSAGARKAEQLESAMGRADRSVFDFQEMAKILRTAPTAEPLPKNRRKRIQLALDIIESQRFYSFRSTGSKSKKPPFEFLFDDCDQALTAYGKRLPEMAALVKAISIAELEIDNHYSEQRHDHYFNHFDQERLGPRDLELFPGYLVAINEVDEHAQQNILRVLSSGLPIKIIAQTHAVLGDSSLIGGQLSFGTKGQHLARMTLGLDRVFVMQASASSLYHLRESVMDGMSIEQPALFSIFTGASYLESAAATESRAFPGFVYNPGAGLDQASQFSLAGNPGVLLGWTEHELSYEDTDHNFESERSAFTLVDFIAQDPQFTQHFVCVPRADWSDDLVPLARYLELSGREKTDKVPYVLLIDSEKVLYRAVVDEKLVDAARRCLSSWRTLQEMAGINNSHAIAAVSEAERIWTDELAQQRLQADPATTTAPDNSAPIPDQATAAEPLPPLEETAPSSDEPWIETIRCTTCNECTQLNDRMFAYDGEKRAYIADPDAGTYRDLVEAAETCQVAIIHPGKPRNPDEADLEALLERAAPFI